MNAVIRVTLPVCYFQLPVIFVLDRWRGVEGSDVFVWVFLKGHALIHSGKWEGHDFFRKKILKYTFRRKRQKKKTSGTQGSLTDEIFRILPVFSQFF